ncbi:uncharacterized protein BT62DRAFT_861919, partial [Guyanagaster necrorhizus]
RFGLKVMKEQVMLDTWNGLIFEQNGEKLLDDWIWTARVLVDTSSHHNQNR